MNEVVRKVVAVDALPEALREGFDAERPVEIMQEPPMRGSDRLRERLAASPHRRFRSGAEIDAYVRSLRDDDDR